MSTHNDVVGLRDQIKENAVVLFPKAAPEYRAYREPVEMAFNERDAFNISIRHLNENEYHAVITCGSDGDLVVAATGMPKNVLSETLASPLEILSKELGRHDVCLGITNFSGLHYENCGFTNRCLH